MVGTPEEAKGFVEFGATVYIVSTDQGFLRKAAAAALAGMRG
jgi:2-keto-3-deoxy-L-rhamnonate aldolase RhmA